jgi:WD40 repeat protein
LKSPKTPHIADLSSDGNTLVILNQILVADKSNPSGWNRKTTISHSADEISSVRISPDGQRVAVGNFGGRVWLHEIESGKQIGVLEESPGFVEPNADANPVCTLCFSEDSRWLAANSSGNVPLRLNFWNIKTGERVQSRTGRSDPICGIVYERRNEQFTTCNGNGRLRFWTQNDATMADEWLMGNPSRGGETLAISPDAKVLAVADRAAKRPTIGLWSINGRYEMLHLPYDATHLQFSNDASKLLAGDTRGAIRLWDVNKLIEASRKQESSPPDDLVQSEDQAQWPAVRVAHAGRAYWLQFTRDGNRIASVGGDGLLQVATRRPSEEFRRLSAGDEVTHFSGFDTAAKEISIAWKRHNGIWRFTPGKAPALFCADRKEEIVTACLHPEGDRIAIVYENRDVQIIDAVSLRPVTQFHLDLPPAEVPDLVSFIPDTSMVVVRVYNEKPLNRFYDVETGKRVEGLPEMSGATLSVAWKRNRIAFSTERQVYYLDIAPGATVKWLDRVADALDDIDISNDGSVIAGSTAARTVIAWDGSDGSICGTIARPSLPSQSRPTA